MLLTDPVSVSSELVIMDVSAPPELSVEAGGTPVLGGGSLARLPGDVSPSRAPSPVDTPVANDGNISPLSALASSSSCFSTRLSARHSCRLYSFSLSGHSCLFASTARRAFSSANSVDTVSGPPLLR